MNYSRSLRITQTDLIKEGNITKNGVDNRREKKRLDIELGEKLLYYSVIKSQVKGALC